MIESLPEESLTDCFLAQSEVLMEGTALLQLPEGMRLDQIQIDFPWVDDNCRCYLPHIVLSTVF